MIALGTGAIMVGSSVFAAVDLANYPAPFVKDGKFSGVLIVGDKAAAEDVIGISDIISSLQFAATKKVTTTTGGDVTVEGDAWLVQTSNHLELSEDLTTGTNRETLRNITTFIDKANLKALGSGTASNSKGTAPYNQYLNLLGPGAGVATGYVTYIEDDNDVTADFLFFKSGTEIGKYLLEFTTALESDVDDSTGASSTTGLFLTDLENAEISLLGKKYTIVTAKRTSSTENGGNNVNLILMGGAGKDTLLEGQTKTYTIGGKDYEVTVTFVDADEAQFTVNGQTTRKLKDGDTEKLSSGTTIGVTDILYQDYAGGIHSTTFFVGANKLELKDTQIRDIVSSNSLKVDDETIDDATVVVEGTNDNSTFKVNKIHVNMTADDNFFVPAGGKLSEVIKAEGVGAEPQVLFTENFDIEYKGLKKVPMEKISLRTSGTSQYNLEFLDGSGNKVSVPIAKSPSGKNMIIGDTDKPFINVEAANITKDAYFVLTDSSRKRGERKTFVLQYKGADKKTADNPVLKFKDIGSGSTIEQTYSDASPLATLKVGGADYKVFGQSDQLTSNDFPIQVDLDASGAVSTDGFNTVNITTMYGAEIGITNLTNTNVSYGSPVSSLPVVAQTGESELRLSIKTPDESRDGNAKDTFENLRATDFVVNITAASGKVQHSTLAGITSGQPASAQLNLRTPDGKTNVAYAYTSYGAWITRETPTNDPATFTVDYPMSQRYPLVYVTTKGTTFGEAAATSTDAVVLQRIEVGAAKLASEVTDVRAQNVILVGGPCVNAAAATVLGNPSDCTAGFEPNVGRIEVWEHSNGNVAMLVAGYSALDTRNSAQVVANYKDYKAQLKGTKIEVKKTNNQLTVAAPVTG